MGWGGNLLLAPTGCWNNSFPYGYRTKGHISLLAISEVCFQLLPSSTEPYHMPLSDHGSLLLQIQHGESLSAKIESFVM